MLALHLGHDGLPVGFWSGPNDYTYYDSAYSSDGERMMDLRPMQCPWDEWLSSVGQSAEIAENWRIYTLQQDKLVCIHDPGRGALGKSAD